MAQKFLTNIDLNGNQILKGTFQKVATDPDSNLFEGWTVYNTAEDCIKYYDGTAWKKLVKGVTSGGTYANALTVSESNGAITLTLNLANASDAGLLSATFYSLLNAATASPTVSTLVLRDAAGRFQAEAPSADKDVANKAYVDAARSGLDVKDSAKFATNGALPTFTHSSGVLTATTNGALSLDGTTLEAGDAGIRVLVKDETSTNAPYNGIYVVTASGGAGAPYVLTRADDANSNTKVTPGMFTFVEQGTVWADSGWVLTTDGSITLGTTGLTFVQFSAAGQSIAGNGLTKTGNTIDVVGTTDRISVSADAVDIASTYVGQTSITTLGTITTGVWNGTDVAVADGGTGASTASDARTNLADTSATGLTTSTPVLARVSSQGCAASVASVSTTTVTHNFGTKNVVVQVYENSTGETVIGDVVRTNTNTVTVTLLGTISANDYYIVVSG
jgi:hypothetical protein